MAARAALRKPDDWVFASKRCRGRKPFWGQAILRKFILPRARALGIEKRFGWHTFRHTYSTVLRSVGTEFKVMQELLRHSSLRSTLDVYTQAITPSKHAAQDAVMTLVLESNLRHSPIWRNGRYSNIENGAKGTQIYV